MMLSTSQEDFTCALLYVRPKALDISTDAVAIYTAESRVVASTIVYANNALASLSGFDLEHFVGHSALLLAGARPDRASMAAVLPRSGQVALLAIVRKYKPDGAIYQVEVVVAPLRNEAGEVTHYLSRQRQIGVASASGVRRSMGVENPAGSWPVPRAAEGLPRAAGAAAAAGQSR